MPKNYKFRKPKGAYKLAKKAYKLARTTANNIEIKAFHHPLAPATINNTTGVVQVCSDIPQGLTYLTRIGQEIATKAIHLKFTLENNNTDAASKEARTRIVLVISKDDDEALPTWSAPSATAYLQDATYEVLSPINWQNRRQYKTLYSEVFIGNEESKQSWFRDIYIRLNHKINFTDATLEGRKGRIFLMAISNVAANMPVITAYTRMKYKDA